MTLLERIEEIEKQNRDTKISASEYKDFLLEQTDQYGEYKEIFKSRILGDYLIFREKNEKKEREDIRTQILEEAETNEVLQDVVSSEKTVQEYLERATQVAKGFKKFLPKRRNKKHNEMVEDLGKIIDVPKQCKTRGVFFPDNPLTAGAYTAAIFATGVIANSYFPEMKDTIFAVTYGLTQLAGIGTIATAIYQDGMHVNTYDAESIDRKIAESGAKL